MTIETIRFANDTQTRKRLMVPESFQHPAKGQLGMWALMIERYSQPGDLVLDPMSGSGATLLAALMGRSVICVELEQHFVEPMRHSWAKMRTMPMLGHEMGQAVILRGDARCLPLPDASVGAAITSPPFLGNHDGLAGDEKEVWRMAAGKLPSIGSLKTPGYTRPVDAIVSSPPYSGGGHHEGAFDTWGGVQRVSEHLADSYTENKHDRENIGNMKGGDLYALLVYNRLRREPNQPVEVHLCGKCLPVESAESLLAMVTQDATDALPSITPNTMPMSSPTSPEAARDIFVPATPKSLGEQSVAYLVPNSILAVGLQDGQNLLNGEPRLEQPTMASLSPSKQAQTTSHGRVAGQAGEALLGVSSDGRCLNETITPVQNAALRNVCVSIISKTQRKLAANGITALETWLLSATPVTSEVTTNIGCLLCNVSLAANPSRPEVPTPNTALLLRFVTPNIAPSYTIAGGQSDYWTAQNEVYAECWRVLKPGGILALVLKGFTRDGKYVDLPGQTEALLLDAGWVKHDHWRRELWSLSFWRILQKRRDPVAWDERLMYEHVLAFRKPDV